MLLLPLFMLNYPLKEGNFYFKWLKYYGAFWAGKSLYSQRTNELSPPIQANGKSFTDDSANAGAVSRSEHYANQRLADGFTQQQDTKYLVDLADVHFKHYNFNEAIQVYKQLINKETDDFAKGHFCCLASHAYFNLKQTKESNQYLEKAKEYFDKVVANDKEKELQCFEETAVLYEAINQIGMAIEYWQKIAEKQPSARVFHKIAHLYSAGKDFKNALLSIDKVIENSMSAEESSHVLSEKIELLINLKEYQQAEDLCREIMGDEHSDKALKESMRRSLLLIYDKTGRLDEIDFE